MRDVAAEPGRIVVEPSNRSQAGRVKHAVLDLGSELGVLHTPYSFGGLKGQRLALG